jgi:bifunctional non-homologous end joining protein LigD
MAAPEHFPPPVPSMLATLGVLPTGAGWAYEFKWDGVRAVTYLQPPALRVVSRNDRDLTSTYPELADLAGLLAGRRVVLDGEIVALDRTGRPSFAELQRRMHVREPSPELLEAVPVSYYVFDLLHLDGVSLLAEPYRRRRELLAGLGLAADRVRVPPNFLDVEPTQVMAAAEAYGLEGVVAKRLTSTYQPGRRSPDWVKVPLIRTQEVVIVGYQPGKGRRAGAVGSLMLAVYNPAGRLSYAGHVGTGFTEAMLRDLYQRVTPLRRSAPPVAGVPREHTRGAIWVEPVLVGEAAYRNWTPDGRLRHPSWRGLRPDRSVAEARRPGRPAGTHPGVPTGQVEGAMQTSDGRWRVEIVRRGADHWYRIVHGENALDWLSLADVEHILAEAGVGLTLLREVGPAA